MNNKKPQSGQELLKKLDDLLADVKKANKDFQKTRLKQKELSREIDKVEAEFNETEKELKRFEKKMINELDKAVLEFLS